MNASAKRSLSRVAFRVLMAIGVFVGTVGCSNCGSTTAVPGTSTSPATVPATVMVRLGYCPTMKQHALRISAQVEGVVLQEHGSAGAAVASLAGKQNDAVIIGRLARGGERGESVAELRLGSGCTLISRAGGFVEYAALAQLRIHTALAGEVARGMFPPGTDIRFHPTPADALREGLDEAVLIDWNELHDEHRLLIPMQDGAKVPSFRLPTIYYQRELGEAKARAMAKAMP